MNVQIAMYNLIKVIVITVYYGVDLKRTFHCHECRICIRGSRENYRHCEECNSCINVLTYDSHNCNVVGDTEAECQICMEEFNKREKFHIILRCSHKIHPACYESLKKSCTDNDKKFNCSLCRKSIICPLKLESFYDKKKLIIIIFLIMTHK
jgi:hypothetical protein